MKEIDWSLGIGMGLYALAVAGALGLACVFVPAIYEGYKNHSHPQQSMVALQRSMTERGVDPMARGNVKEEPQAVLKSTKSSSLSSYNKQVRKANKKSRKRPCRWVVVDDGDGSGVHMRRVGSAKNCYDRGGSMLSGTWGAQ